MNKILFILDRLDEPSTWAGLAVILTLTGTQLPDGFSNAMAQLAASVAAVIGIFMKETGGKP